MDWATFVPSLIGAGLGTTFAGALLASWLNRKYYEYTEKKEKEKRRREASVAVAELLGEWIKPAYMGPSSNEDVWRLQTKYWENVLRLDKDLVELLAAVFQNKLGGPGSKDAIVEARKVLHGYSKPDIKADQLIHWPRREENLKA